MLNADFSKWVDLASVASLMVWLARVAGQEVNGAVLPVYGHTEEFAKEERGPVLWETDPSPCDP